MEWRLYWSDAQRTSSYYAVKMMEGKTGIQKGLVNLKGSTKSTRHGSAFQSPLPREDKGQAGMKNGERLLPRQCEQQEKILEWTTAESMSAILCSCKNIFVCLIRMWPNWR